MHSIIIPTKKYVYFDNNGNILSISGSNTSDGQFVEVDLNDVINLINGTENITSYIVVYDISKKTYVLKEKFSNEEIIFNVNDQIHQVPKIKSTSPDISIIQNIKYKTWNFLIDTTLKENLLSQNLSLDKILYFHITRKNDPHELYRTLTVNIATLVEDPAFSIEFTSENELDDSNISVYTVKRLQSYYHGVNK
jgi:hypothetical protein